MPWNIDFGTQFKRLWERAGDFVGVLPLVAVTIAAGCVNTTSASGDASHQVAQPLLETTSPEVSVMRATNLEIRQFSVQLTNTNLAAIDGSDTELVIIDPTGIDRMDIERLRVQPDGSRRAVVAYINIGEAETYRDYWRSEWNSRPPRWLGAENPDWANHYYTAYWEAEWQAILFGTPGSILDRILAVGFDGVFMDGVDKYMVWPNRVERSKRDMYVLVDRIANYTRARTPGFLVIPNNAEDLLDNAAYRSTIDAIVKEDLFFGVGGEGRPNDPGLVNWSLGQLRLATNDGLPVLVIEYVNDPGQRRDVVDRLQENRLLGTFGPRDLARPTLPIPAGANAVNQLRNLPARE